MYYYNFGSGLRGHFLIGIVFIYAELPERPVVFGCVYCGGWGVVVVCVGGGGDGRGDDGGGE